MLSLLLQELVSEKEMVDRIKSAIAARSNSEFVIMAKTCALSRGNSIDEVVSRSKVCCQKKKNQNE